MTFGQIDTPLPAGFEMNPTWGYPTRSGQDEYGGVSYDMLPEWSPSRPIGGGDVTGANGLLDLSPTSRAWESLWGSTVDNPYGSFSYEAAKKRFGKDPRAFAGGLINLGLTEGNASKIPQTLIAAGYSPEYAAQVEQQVRNINSNQHNESSGFDLGPLLAMGGIGLALGGFPAFGALSGLGDSAAMAALDSGAGLWGAPAAEAAGGWGVNAATGGGMPFDFGSYNPSDPFGFAGDAASSYGSISEPFTGAGFPSSSGSFAGYDFGLGYPVGGNMVTNLAGGGLIPRVESLLGPLTQKIGEQAAKSLLSKVINGTATTEDYANIAGKLGAAALGLLGSNQQATSLNSLAAKYQEYGAPSRARFEASMTPGFDPNSIGGYAGALDTVSKGILARLSATGGNPFGNPGGLIDANKQIVSGTAMPAINEYQRLNANTGFGSSMNAALGLQTQGIGADANALNSLGYGLNALTNQQPQQQSLADLLKALSGSGLKLNDGTSL